MAENRQNKILNVPHLRFPEFSGEWEEKTIDDLFELRNGYTPSKANHSFWDGGTIPWFRMEDIRQNGGVLSDAIQHITPQAVKGSGLFEPYSIILATTATIGEHAILIADSLANQQFTNFKVRKSLADRYDPYYLYYYFFKIDKWCLKNTNAGGLLSVDIPSLKRKQIYAPCFEEQKKIAKLLSLLDDRIATQNKIIEKLQSLIKGIRQRIFLDIDDDESHLLGDFLEEYSEKNITNNLQSVAVGKYGIRKREDIYSKQLSADYSMNKVIRKDTLVIGMGTTQIDIGILSDDECYCVSPAYTTFRIKAIDSFYLQEYLIALSHLLSVRYMITSVRQGKSVDKEGLLNHALAVHAVEEQKTISKKFKTFYRFLQIEKQILQHYKKQKAFFLKEMFI